MVSTAQEAAAKSQGSVLTKADMVIISLLLERSMHGYDIGQEYERQEVKDWASVSKAQIYYALKKLAAAGILESRDAQDAADPRGKTTYSVTPDGKQMLAEALEQQSWITERKPQPFATWLGLSMHAKPETRAKMIAQRKAFLIAEIERERGSLSFVQALGTERAKLGSKIIELTIATIETELNWLNSLQK